MENKYYLGIDVGTSYVKAIIIDENAVINGMAVRRTSPDIAASINGSIDDACSGPEIDSSSLAGSTATGFGRKKVMMADAYKTEISCHARGAFHYFPEKITIIDIGGQDTKIIRLDGSGRRVNFKMNRKCAAGTGSFLEEVANRLDVKLDEMNELAKKSTKNVKLGSYCTVFASTEVLNRMKDGERIEDLARSVFESIAKRVLEMEKLEGKVIITGGLIAHNDYLAIVLEDLTGIEPHVPSNPQMTGALGAALFARDKNHGRF